MQVINGTDGDDRLRGPYDMDDVTIFDGIGNDTIGAGYKSSNSIYFGGDGNDSIYK